jgi:hypothetical protein
MKAVYFIIPFIRPFMNKIDIYNIPIHLEKKNISSFFENFDNLEPHVQEFILSI